MSSPPHKPITVHELPLHMTDPFLSDIDPIGDTTVDLIFSDFNMHAFPGLAVDPEGFLRCAILPATNFGLLYAIDKRAFGLHLLALRKIGLTSRSKFGFEAEDLEALIRLAKKIGKRGKSTMEHLKELRDKMSEKK